MAEEDLKLTARKLSGLFDDLIIAWREREAVAERLEEVEREGPPAPPQPQPVEDLMVLARHARERKRHAKDLMAATVAKDRADVAYDEAATALVMELVPENISDTQTYLSVTRTYPEGDTYIIDILPDSVIVRLQEQ
jgi:hypothetical protein